MIYCHQFPVATTHPSPRVMEVLRPRKNILQLKLEEDITRRDMITNPLKTIFRPAPDVDCDVPENQPEEEITRLNQLINRIHGQLIHMNGCNLKSGVFHFQLSGHSMKYPQKYPQSIRTSMTTALSNCSRPVAGIY
jgi:hypothetical protein